MLFKVEVDKLSGDSGDIEADVLDLTYVVGEKEKPKDDPDDQTEDDDKKPPAGDGQNGNQNGSGNQGGSGNQSGNGNQGGTGNQSGSGNRSGSNSSNKSGVKTGDNTPVAKYLVLGAGSCLVVLGLGVARLKRRKR